MFRFQYNYAILRYVPDLKRCEPLNFGVIVEKRGRAGSSQEVALRFNKSFNPRSKKHSFNRKNYKEWINFFEERTKELQKESVESIIKELRENLRNTPHNYTLTESLIFESNSDSLDATANYLYDTCVA